MSNRLLQMTGEALYGPQWQSPLSRDLDCNVRTIQRWLAGVNDPPDGIWLDLLRLTQERAMMLDALADDLRRAGAPGEPRPED